MADREGSRARAAEEEPPPGLISDADSHYTDPALDDDSDSSGAPDLVADGSSEGAPAAAAAASAPCIAVLSALFQAAPLFLNHFLCTPLSSNHFMCACCADNDSPRRSGNSRAPGLQVTHRLPPLLAPNLAAALLPGCQGLRQPLPLPLPPH